MYGKAKSPTSFFKHFVMSLVEGLACNNPQKVKRIK